MKIIRTGIIAIASGIIVGCSFFVKLHHINANVPAYPEEGDGSIQVYFINLDKSVDRLDNMQPQLEALGYPFERVPAVYGKDLSEEYRNGLTNPKKYRILMHNEIGVGTIGCYLSHVKTWNQFLQSRHSYALIFEDDVEFEPKKLKKLVDLLLASSADWDFVNIDVNRHGFSKPVKQLSRLFKLVKFRTRVANASCYLINRKSALEFVKRAFPISMPVDHYMMRPWEFGIRIRGVTPQLVHQSFGDSEIKKQETKHSTPFAYVITSVFYQITAEVMSFISSIKD